MKSKAKFLVLTFTILIAWLGLTLSWVNSEVDGQLFSIFTSAEATQTSDAFMPSAQNPKIATTSTEEEVGSVDVVSGPGEKRVGKIRSMVSSTIKVDSEELVRVNQEKERLQQVIQKLNEKEAHLNSRVQKLSRINDILGEKYSLSTVPTKSVNMAYQAVQSYKESTDETATIRQSQLEDELLIDAHKLLLTNGGKVRVGMDEALSLKPVIEMVKSGSKQVVKSVIYKSESTPMEKVNVIIQYFEKQYGFKPSVLEVSDNVIKEGQLPFKLVMSKAGNTRTPTSAN